MMGKVFLITADVMTEHACRLRLERSGFDVAQTSSGGFAALDQAQRFMPDCIVVDAQLPGLNGLEVLKWITGVPSIVKIPIVLLAERTLPHATLQDCMLWGARRVVFKDADPPADIASVVRKLVGAQQPSSR
jgi:CheY-like chemotaxis protein